MIDWERIVVSYIYENNFQTKLVSCLKKKLILNQLWFVLKNNVLNQTGLMTEKNQNEYFKLIVVSIEKYSLKQKCFID